MQFELRKKQNSAVYDEEKSINKQIVNKMYSQLDLWNEEIPKNRKVSTEDALTIENQITELIAILNEKTTAIDTLIFKNKGVEELFSKIVNNNDFLSKYNNLIKPLTQSKNQSLKTAIETQLQLLNEPLEKILIAYKALLKDTKIVNLSRVSGVFNAYALYKLVFYQIDVGQFKTINNELINSSKYDAQKDLLVETRYILNKVEEQYNLMPSERKKVYIEDPSLKPPTKEEELKTKGDDALRTYFLQATDREATSGKQEFQKEIKKEVAIKPTNFIKVNELKRQLAIINEIMKTRKETTKLKGKMPSTPLGDLEEDEEERPIKRRVEEGAPA